MDITSLLSLRAFVKSNNLNKYMRILNVDGKFTSIYPFTTENIKGYLDLMDVSNRDVLTVGASGDQALNLLVKGARSVDYFDINPFTEMYFNLKCAAIKALDLNDYLKFFCRDAFPDNPAITMSAFDINIYHEISPYLDKNTRKFWDSLYSKIPGINIRNSSLFSIDEESVKTLPKTNYYLNEESFKNLKNILCTKNKSEFIKTDITKLPHKLTKKYDYILLSNIAQYLKDIYGKNELERFRELIIELSKSLNSDGKMMISYLYGPKETPTFGEDWIGIYNIKKVRETFKEENLELLYFDSEYGISRNIKSSDKDAALIYTKKN